VFLVVGESGVEEFEEERWTGIAEPTVVFRESFGRRREWACGLKVSVLVGWYCCCWWWWWC